MKDLRIVIPAYNEESGIGEVLDRIIKSCPEAELLVVDDCSKDKTGQIAESKGAIVIRNQTNQGYGGALKTGFQYQSSGDRIINYFAFLDADGTYPPEAIPALYQACKKDGYKIAVGSRISGQNLGMPFIRALGNKLFARLAAFYSNKNISDTASGIRVFEKSMLPMVLQLPDGLQLTPAMSINALFIKIPYIEIPIEYEKREGRSKLSAIKDGYRFLSVIMDATRKYNKKAFYCTLGIPYILVKSVVNACSAKK